MKKLWAYIREKNLQDPKNKRNIICDESLRSIFDVDSIDMFQMNKALTKHIWAVREEDGMCVLNELFFSIYSTLRKPLSMPLSRNLSSFIFTIIKCFPDLNQRWSFT